MVITMQPTSRKLCAMSSSTCLLTASLIWIVTAGSPCNAVVGDTGPFFRSIEIEKKNSIYQLVAELTGGEECALLVDFLEVEFQTPSNSKAITFEHVSTNENGKVVVKTELLKDLFIAIVGVNNYTAQATAQEIRGRMHGPDMLTCNCVGACDDVMTTDMARSICTVIPENTTTSLPMAPAHKEHTVPVPTMYMPPISFNAVPLQLGDMCELDVVETKPRMGQGRRCRPGTQCMPVASSSPGIKNSVGDTERHTCQLPFMQAGALHINSGSYLRKTRDASVITSHYVCTSVVALFLLFVAISAYVISHVAISTFEISHSPYKTFNDGQDSSDEEFVE